MHIRTLHDTSLSRSNEGAPQDKPQMSEKRIARLTRYNTSRPLCVTRFVEIFVPSTA